mmetsp:Transcript_70825/g.110861  ORF Transcript_70825/g.110861 Transcript_70825/m.110861 type:complete len:265 (-) Transcript_70825:122-916(-)
MQRKRKKQRALRKKLQTNHPVLPVTLGTRSQKKRQAKKKRSPRKQKKKKTKRETRIRTRSQSRNRRQRIRRRTTLTQSPQLRRKTKRAPKTTRRKRKVIAANPLLRRRWQNQRRKQRKLGARVHLLLARSEDDRLRANGKRARPVEVKVEVLAGASEGRSAAGVHQLERNLGLEAAASASSEAEAVGETEKIDLHQVARENPVATEEVDQEGDARDLAALARKTVEDVRPPEGEPHRRRTLLENSIHHPAIKILLCGKQWPVLR